MEFSRQEYWRGLPFPFPVDLPDPGIEAGSPALQADSLLSELRGKPSVTDAWELRFLRLFISENLYSTLTTDSLVGYRILTFMHTILWILKALWSKLVVLLRNLMPF